jgi:hypothetical protein
VISISVDNIVNKIIKIEYWDGKYEVWMDDGKILNLRINKLYDYHEFDTQYKKAYGYSSGIDSDNWDVFYQEFNNKKNSLN